MYNITDLNDKLVSELREIAKELKISGSDHLRKQELIYKILDLQSVDPTSIKKTIVDAPIVSKPQEIKTEAPQETKHEIKEVKEVKEPRERKLPTPSLEEPATVEASLESHSNEDAANKEKDIEEELVLPEKFLDKLLSSPARLKKRK